MRFWVLHHHRWDWLPVREHGRTKVWACAKCGLMCRRDRGYLGRVFV